MRLLYIIYIILGGLALNCGCSPQDEPVETGIQETMDVGIRLLSLDESMNVRLIITNADNGIVLFNDYLRQADPVTGNYTVRLREGRMNFYFLANEPSRLPAKLDGIGKQAEINPVTIMESEIPDIEQPEDSESKTNLPVGEILNVIVRDAAGASGTAEVSSDNGANWSDILNVGLRRLASKISLWVVKNTDPADEITIRKVELLNVPSYAYLIPQAYTGAQRVHLEPFTESMPPVVLTANANPDLHSNFTCVFSNEIIPEYLMPAPSDEANSVVMHIHAKYNQKTVVYKVPVRANAKIDDFDLERNKHYMIYANIISQGELVYMPEVTYKVADWTDTPGDHVFDTTITFESRWVNGTNVSGRDVRVEYGDSVEFLFSLSHPKGATWSASLTNTADFTFDYSDGAVSGGIAEDAHIYKVRIAPRKETSLNDIKTEFLISVNNGQRNVELNLPAQIAGTGNRYVITQIPH